MQQTKTRPQQLTALPPADPLGVRFCQWFNHGWHWIYAETPEPGQKAQWFTETRYSLQPRNLWQEYQDPEKIIGLRFDNYETRYTLIDIDRGGSYHPANDRDRFKAVLTALETIGLCRPLLVRSSDSGGIHVYYFLPEAAPTFNLACAIKFALEDAGCYLHSGHLEVFPNCKAYSKDRATDYNGHRLPLQAGSYWLDSDGLPISNNLESFLDAADVAAANQDMAALNKAIAAAGKNRRRLRFAPDMSRNAAEWKRHLEERITEGWSAHHQTNELLKDFAIYGVVWQALKGTALINFVVETAKAAPGYEQWCRHISNIRHRAAEWAKAAEGWYSPYRSFPKRDGRSYQANFEPPQNNIVKLENQANVKNRELAAERIRQAIAHLKATDTLPYGATARAAAIIATVKELTGKGMSLATLHRDCHLSLWHPGHQKSLEPAQGKTLHPVVEVNTLTESLEPAQGKTLHPTPLYEGAGQDGRLPQLPLSGGSQPPIQPLETSPPTSTSDSGCCCPRRDPSTDDCHTNCHNTTSEAVKAAWKAEATPEAQPAALEPQITASELSQTPPAASSSLVPSGADKQTIWRLTKINLAAIAHAKKAVKMQQLMETCLFTPVERQHQETLTKMQYLWNSGEPLLMDEVKRWLAANPSRQLDLSVPDGANSAIIASNSFCVNNDDTHIGIDTKAINPLE